LRRVDWFKHPGYQIRLPKAILADAWYVLSNNEFRPAGDEAFQSLRMESTFPLYGVDITTDNLAQEVGRTSECISFTKGCYLGQEPIARIDAMGHVNRELRGLYIDSKTPPVAGANILDEDDKTVGQVTSAAHSLGEEDAIALGYVRRSHLATGTNVRIEMADGPVAAQVFHRDGD
jgi:hypothetical protein